MFVRALTAIQRSPYQALVALMMVFVTTAVAFSLTTFLYGAQTVLQYFEQSPEVIAFFELDTNPSIIKNAQQTMEEKPYVTSANLVTQEQALALYQEESTQNPLLLELVTAEFLPASLEVSGIDAASLRQIAEDLSDLPGVEDIQFQADIVAQLESWVRSLRLTGLVVLAALTFITFLTISIIIALKASTKKHSINVMRSVGATRWYISTPYMLEASLYGLFGTLLGWGLMYAVVWYFTEPITFFLGEITVLPLAPEFLAIQLGTGVILSILFSSFAARAAVGRMIRY